MTETLDFYVRDLSADSVKKVLLSNETKQGLIDLVSNEFVKPLFKIYITKEDLNLLRKSDSELIDFKYIELDKEDKPEFKIGDFFMNVELQEAL
jgi:hypothetical protein